MTCDWWHQCVRDATAQIVVRDTADGSKQTQYYCPAHTQMRLAEIKASDHLELLTSTDTESSI